MSDFLDRVVHIALGSAPVVKPLVRPIYAPGADTPALRRIDEEAVVTGPRERAQQYGPLGMADPVGESESRRERALADVQAVPQSANAEQSRAATAVERTHRPSREPIQEHKDKERVIAANVQRTDGRPAAQLPSTSTVEVRAEAGSGEVGRDGGPLAAMTEATRSAEPSEAERQESLMPRAGIGVLAAAESALQLNRDASQRIMADSTVPPPTAAFTPLATIPSERSSRVPEPRTTELKPSLAGRGEAHRSEAVAPVIRVSIGRVEVRAVAAPPAPTAPPRAKPKMSLDEYLRAQSGGRRE